MDRLAKNNFAGVSPSLRKDLLAYYGDLNAPFATKKNRKEWNRVVVEVEKLKAGETDVARGPSSAEAPSKP